MAKNIFFLFRQVIPKMLPNVKIIAGIIPHTVKKFQKISKSFFFNAHFTLDQFWGEESEFEVKNALKYRSRLTTGP